MENYIKRNTIQKKVILDELKKSKKHPTAHELYDIIRVKMPTISLGTIYRNLEILSSEGIIRKIKHADKKKRYDAITDEHYHIRCIHCERIEDLTYNVCEDIEKKLGINTEYEIKGCSLLFEGICPDCKKKMQ